MTLPDDTEPRSAGIVRVALDTPADDCFDYLAAPDVSLGDLVVVPFGAAAWSAWQLGALTNPRSLRTGSGRWPRGWTG